MEYLSVMREAVFLDVKKHEAGGILLRALGASSRFGDIKVDNVIEGILHRGSQSTRLKSL